MRLGFVLPDLSGGGAEKVFVDLANEASKQHDVFLILESAEGRYINLVSDRVNIVEIGFSNPPTLVFKLIKTIKKFDLECIYGTLSMANIVGFTRLFWGQHCTCIARLGNTLSSDFERFGFFGKLLHYFWGLSLFLSHKVVVQSCYMRDDLVSIYGNFFVRRKVQVIYNPVDLSNIICGFKEKEKSVYKSEESTPFRFLAVGRLEWQKDYPALINAFAKLSENNTVTLDILGEGALRKVLENMVASKGLEDKVFFRGFVDDVDFYYAKCDAYVLTSRYEGFSNSLLKAAALGMPVVATNSPGGNSEIIQDGVNGLLVSVGDVGKISKAMEKSMWLNVEQVFDFSDYEVRSVIESYLEVGSARRKF